MNTAWGTVTLPEILWTAIGLLGLRFKLPNVNSARKAVLAVNKLNGNNILGHAEMLILVKRRLGRELWRIVESVVIIMAGVASMLTPSPKLAHPYHVGAGAIIVTVCLLSIEIIDVYQSYADKKTADDIWESNARSDVA